MANFPSGWKTGHEQTCFNKSVYKGIWLTGKVATKISPR